MYKFSSCYRTFVRAVCDEDIGTEVQTIENKIDKISQNFLIQRLFSIIYSTKEVCVWDYF